MNDITVKDVDLSGVDLPNDDASTCTLIYNAVRNTYGFPVYLHNFKISGTKRDAILVNPIMLTDSVVINLGDYYLTVTTNAITVTAGVNLIGATIDSDGDVEIGKNLEVDGTATLTGNVTMGGTLGVEEGVSIGGGATITGNTSIGGDLEVTGDIKGMEKIVDSDGNARFVEGDITLESSFTTLGVTKLYGKWSLSGTHLMIVLALSIPSGVTTPENGIFCEITLPSFIHNKLTGLWGNVLEVKDITFRDATLWYSGVAVLNSVYLNKIGDNKVRLNTSAATITTEVESTCRIQFDLLIDAEPAE